MKPPLSYGFPVVFTARICQRRRPGRRDADGSVRLFGRPAPDVLPREGERLEGAAQAKLVLTRQVGEVPRLYSSGKIRIAH